MKGSARGSVHWGCYYDTARTLRLTLNAAALAAASPTLLFRPVVECSALEHRSASELLVCDDIPAAVKCASVSRIVSVLLLIGSYLALRSNTQRRIQVLRVRQAPVLLRVAA